MLTKAEQELVALCRGANRNDDWNGYYVLDLVAVIDRLVAGAWEPEAWQWRYVGETEWKTPSGGNKLTAEELKRERQIEQRPLYSACLVTAAD